MLTYPEFDPVALSVGPLKIHWYGLMYLAGFGLGAWLGIHRAKRGHLGWKAPEVTDLLFYVAVGVILGGRLGYALFYNLPYYLQNPLQVFALWDGGMSFHGGLLGVLAALWLYGRKSGRTFLRVGDFVAPLCAPGLGFGRIGNFINQELWGRPTELPWGMVFPLAGPEPRHPSQLYEALLEGVVLFAVVWLYSRRPRATGRVSGLFLAGYGVFRFLVEFAREPDAHLGPVALDWVTMGQLLSVPMVVFGLWLLWRPQPGPTSDPGSA